ncbi:Ger(x)C family spore germination protein [Virgibacillus xinjiangensis]|uniref:Ger(X)C family spore germination protein n=1 Tax=Virgibacillus xinjiangensis TaxID=393090 RepID=A0ABV7CR79_9BACI
MPDKKTVFHLLIILLLLTACAPTREIERLGIIHTLGIDVTDDGQQIETTMVIFQFDEQAATLTKNVIGQGKTVRGARNDASNQSAYHLASGQMQLQLFGKEAAEQGILPYLNMLVRDATVSDTMFLTVTNQTAKEILTTGRELTEINIGQFLYGVIEQEKNEHKIPRSDLQMFSRTYFEPGQDPWLPVMDIEEELPAIVSMGIFQDDRYVGELSLKEAFYLNLFINKIAPAPLELSLPREPFQDYMPEKNNDSEESLDIKIQLKGNTKTKLVDKEELRYQTNVKVQFRLDEFSEVIVVEDEKVAELFEKEIAKKMEEEYGSLLRKLQDMQSDPFGFGKYYRLQKKNGEMTSDEWRELYPDISVDFNVDAELIHYGTIQ